jgi:hypothetical protein
MTMAIDMLQKFFGSNPQHQQEYSDFVQRYQDDPNSISNDEAARRYRDMMRNSPSGLAADAHDEAFAQVPQADRRKLAEHFQGAAQDPNRPFNGYHFPDPDQAADPHNIGQMAHQAGTQDPDLLEQLIGKDSPLNSTLGRAALAGAAAYIASRVISGKGINAPGSGIPGLHLGQGGTPSAPTTSAPGAFDKQA